MLLGIVAPGPIRASSSPTVMSHPAFFNGEASLGEDWYYLEFASMQIFGYYNCDFSRTCIMTTLDSNTLDRSRARSGHLSQFSLCSRLVLLARVDYF